MLKLRMFLLCAALGLGGPLAAGEAAYDLMFRTGTLDAVPKDHKLLYTRRVENTLVGDAAARDSGAIELSFAGSDPLVAHLRFLRDGKHRNIGDFPASVGNPVIMYFVETVVRDMAESAGGSPFYIRNRVKDALVAPAAVATGEAVAGGRTVPVKRVTLRPFEGDPSAGRMKGFGALELQVTMSDAVPGWYLSLRAVAPGEGGAVYDSELRFEAAEAAQ